MPTMSLISLRTVLCNYAPNIYYSAHISTVRNIPLISLIALGFTKFILKIQMREQRIKMCLV
jgi:hypothetical protein